MRSEKWRCFSSALFSHATTLRVQSDPIINIIIVVITNNIINIIIIIIITATTIIIIIIIIIMLCVWFEICGNTR